MVVKRIIDDILPSIWPMITFILIVAITLRCAYLFKGSRKFVLHKELLHLVFIIYILCLYYILIVNDGSMGVVLVPFRAIFSYSFGSYEFIQNIISNILLFVPFGFFASYYLNSRKTTLVLGVSLLVAGLSEGLQYYVLGAFIVDDIILNVFGGFLGYLIYVALNAIKGKLPKFMRSDAFINLIVILLIVLVVLFSFDINIFNYM